jgi:hypothetical protein
MKPEEYLPFLQLAKTRGELQRERDTTAQSGSDAEQEKQRLIEHGNLGDRKVMAELSELDTIRASIPPRLRYLGEQLATMTGELKSLGLSICSLARGEADLLEAQECEQWRRGMMAHIDPETYGNGNGYGISTTSGKIAAFPMVDQLYPYSLVKKRALARQGVIAGLEEKLKKEVASGAEALISFLQHQAGAVAP